MVRVETDVAVTGIGYGGGGVAAAEVVNKHFNELLSGRQIDSVEDIAAVWDHLYESSMPYGRKGIAVMALSGVDLALFDLLGRAEGKPVYDLLGGKTKDRVPAYATGPDSQWYQEMGFKAHKFPHRWSGDNSDYETAVASAARARELFGPDAKIMIDTYMSWNSPVTLEMARRLSEFDIYWFEDVLNPDDLVGQAALREPVKPVLIAGGEHEFTHHGFEDIARAGALDLWQPDITWCGGITAGRRILEIGRREGIPVVPHRGGEVWGLHLIMASDDINLAETNPGWRDAPRDQLWFGEPELKDGYLEPSDGPGFGPDYIGEAML